MFWDRNGDGMITPADVWTGFRDLGFTVPICLLACTLIPLNFSYPTRLAYSYLPDPLFRIYVGGIHKAKVGHSSATLWLRHCRLSQQLTSDNSMVPTAAFSTRKVALCPKSSRISLQLAGGATGH